MFLSEPAKTDYDFHFTIFGFPVRVHPAFFIMPVLLGSGFIRGASQQAGMNTGVAMLVLIAVFFVSILVHELGHAFAHRYYGRSSRIVLYWMGGLAISEGVGNSWAVQNSRTLSPQQQIVVSLAGPFAGFLLAALLVGVIFAVGGTIVVRSHGIFPDLIPDNLPDSFSNALRLLMFTGLWANVFINLLNLAPVFPLDGGQVARQLFIMKDAWNGIRYSFLLSIVAAILIALIGFSTGDRFIGLFFGFMAWSNYMSLQQFGGGGYGGSW